MSKLKSLTIDKRDNVKGLHTYCSKCKCLTTARVCGKTKKRISSCKFPQFHKFKVIKAIPGSGSKKKRTKILATRDINEAIKQKIIFENELEVNQYQATPILVVEEEEKIMPMLLIDCMAYYIGYLNNEGAELHQIKERSKGHIDEVERAFRYFCKSLKRNKVDHTILEIDSLNDKMVGMYHDYLLNIRKLANATYNKYIATIRQFIMWLVDKKDYRIKNPFKSVIRKVQATNNEIIYQDEFESLLKVIKPENGLKKFPSGTTKDLYRYWLKNAFKLALETGLRREEFMTLKFSNIIEKDELPRYIRVENFKVNRAKDIKAEKSKQYKLIPVTKGLREMFEDLNYSENRNTELYIIAPEAKVMRKTLMDKASKAFTHFWAITGIDKEIQLKNLRKTYLTALANHFGDSANLISDHANMAVLKKHYINNEKMVDKASDFSVFEMS